MTKQIVVLILIIAIALSASSCQVKQPVDISANPAVTTTVKSINLPSLTSLAPTAPPATPSSEVILIPTIVPTTPAAPPTSFVTYSAPFAFMPDNHRILVRADAGVQIFNLQTMKEEQFLVASANLGPAVALSPDGEILAWALEDHTIQLIQLSDGKLLHTLTGNTDIITKLKFSPNGDRLFSASHDTWVRIWDRNGNLVHAFQPAGADGFPSEVLGMGVSPDGTRLATIPFDGPVKIWDLDDYKLVRELGGSGGYDTSDIAYSPDGQLIAADLATGLFLWNTSDGRQLLGGNPGINSMAVAFSPDGRYLAYADIGDNNNIILSSPDGAQKIRTLEDQQAPAWELIFSLDSSLMASAGVEIRIWRVGDGKLLFIGKSACP